MFTNIKYIWKQFDGQVFPISQEFLWTNVITKIKKQSQIKYVSYSQTISRQNYQNYSQNNYSRNYTCNGSAHRMHSEWLQAASRRNIWSPRGLGIACSSFEVERRKKKEKRKKAVFFFFLILVWLYYLCLNFWLTGHVLWGEMCDGGFFPLLVRKLVVSTPCFLKLFEMRPLVINYVLTTYMSSISFFKWENRSLLLNARWLSMLFQKSSGRGDLREMTGFLTVWQMGRGENV